MRKYIVYSLLLIITFLLSGCNNKLTDLNGKDKSLYEIDETATYKNLNYRVTEVKFINEEDQKVIFKDSILKNPNNVILAITYEVENNSKEEISNHDIEPEALLNVDDHDINSSIFIRNPSDPNIYIKPGEIFRETDYFEISAEYEKISYCLIICSKNEIKMNINLNL